MVANVVLFMIRDIVKITNIEAWIAHPEQILGGQTILVGEIAGRCCAAGCISCMRDQIADAGPNLSNAVGN